MGMCTYVYLYIYAVREGVFSYSLNRLWCRARSANSCGKLPLSRLLETSLH